MTREDANKNTNSIGNRAREVLKKLLDQLKEDAQSVVDAMTPRPRPILQPIPVRVPVPRRRS